jgi:hypothetical protein
MKSVKMGKKFYKGKIQMKVKGFSKKLSLNKKTIANLDSGEMKNVYVGKATTWWPSCNTTCIVSCGGC